MKPTKIDTIIDNSQAVVVRIGRKLLLESKNAIAEGLSSQGGRARDLLSLLVRANTSKDIPENQRLDDKDVIVREDLSSIVYSMLSANKQRCPHSSSLDTRLRGNYDFNVQAFCLFIYNSTAATWALFALTQNVTVQERLRNELLGVSTDNPTMNELNALPFLDCVVRETLRLYAPVRVIGSWVSI
jgi:hypothetical protein